MPSGPNVLRTEARSADHASANGQLACHKPQGSVLTQDGGRLPHCRSHSRTADEPQSKAATCCCAWKAHRPRSIVASHVA